MRLIASEQIKKVAFSIPVSVPTATAKAALIILTPPPHQQNQQNQQNQRVAARWLSRELASPLLQSLLLHRFRSVPLLFTIQSLMHPIISTSILMVALSLILLIGRGHLQEAETVMLILLIVTMIIFQTLIRLLFVEYMKELRRIMRLLTSMSQLIRPMTRIPIQVTKIK
ncbi:hypothetical protein BSZ32_12815 [Rubritalea profundi]|uniref:Uncharacterized protein n=1 Tax=Rubritalea profundi TaxID=1658618 RepID=A0A2S7U2S4_9BACT|nr:hypothetical protein BSZ32_12815 [Rubritalea profundi]